MRKVLVFVAAIVAGMLPMGSADAVTVHSVSRHVQHVNHLRHMLHVLNTTHFHNNRKNAPHIPPCNEEDGSGQMICEWNAQTMGNGEGEGFVVRVVKVYGNGDVLRKYEYADHAETMREGF